MTADFRVAPLVTTPAQRAYTRASFVIDDRVPGLTKTFDEPLPAAAGAKVLSQTTSAARDTMRTEQDEPTTTR